MVKCTDLYANGLEMDYDLAMEIRNVWSSYGHSSLEMAHKKANKYLKVGISTKNIEEHRNFSATEGREVRRLS